MRSHEVLLQQIATWHSSSQHAQIRQAILGVPARERSDALLGLLARALLNQGDFLSALETLESTAARSDRDPWYCLRRALTLWLLHREDKALPWFVKAQGLGLEEMDELPGTYFPKSVSQWVARAETWAPRRAEINAFEAQRRAARKKQPVHAHFTAKDLAGLWDTSAYGLDTYTGAVPTADQITAVESELGYRLPEAYKALVQQHNGGMLLRNACPNPMQRDWATAAFSVESIYGVDYSKPHSLCGSRGSRFWMEEWGYPDVGIAIGDTISGGHQMIFLDYSDCDPEGEPCVVSIDQESHYEISYVADSFADFIRSLAPAEDE